MFEVITVIAVVLAIAIAVVLILAAGKPAAFSVERAITIAAPAERIFPLINDFHQWAIVVALGEEGSGDEAQL